jgi:hypothetical protein
MGAAGIVGKPPGLGAIGGIVGAVTAGTEGRGASPVLPEILGASLLGTSFSFCMSLGGVGIVVGTTGEMGAAQGLTTGPHSQDGFLQHPLILSSKLGR